MAERRRRDWLAPAVIAALLVIPPLTYVAGYFTLCKTSYSSFVAFKVRQYPYRWLAFVYEPASDVEEALTGKEIVVLPAAEEWVTFPADQ